MDTNNVMVDVSERVTCRVRLEIDVEKAEKLRVIAKLKKRSQSELIELFIDGLPDVA